MDIDSARQTQISRFKRTKMIVTIGPATNSYEAVKGMLKAGANGIRMNFSHGNHDEFEQQIKWIRKASEECSKPIAIIQDLQGPKVRLGDFPDIINVRKGQELRFAYNSDYEENGVIPTQYDLSSKVKRGERLYLYDGKIRMVITSVSGGIVGVKALNEGILISRKGINLPDTDFGGDVITKKDRMDMVFGVHHDIDYVAQSFVQTADDVKKMKKILRTMGSDAKVIAKIETKSAVDNLESIIKEADSVMVARGDLAVETEPESVPVTQRRIIGLCLKHGKLSIVATQMLATMTDAPEPTRAEVSDVATAVLVNADCVMLSDETAMGKYPIEAVKMMKRIILYTQENNPLSAHFLEDKHEMTMKHAISTAIIKLGDQLNASAIVAETKSGGIAMAIASYRPKRPVFMVTSSKRVAQQLAIVYGGKSFVRPDSSSQAIKLTDWLRQKKLLRKGDIVVTASGKFPGVVGTTDTIKVVVLE